MNYYLVIKRLLDFLISLTFITLLSPLIILISFVIKLTSKGPIFYRGCRAGKHNKNFYIIKFRSMVPNAEELGGPSTALNDKRLTPFGKFLRNNKLDEFPQLFNVLIGDMSFVGPRPALFNQYYLIKKRKILKIDKLKPGITGYAQINGRDKISIKKKLKLDYFYLKNKSFKFDIEIIFITAYKFVNSKNIIH